MVIAVNATYWGNNQFQAQNYYAALIIQQIALAQPEHQFIVLVNKGYNYPIEYANNVQFHSIKLSAKTSFPINLFQQISFPAIVKKYNPNLIIQANGFCSLFTQLPQMLVINNNNLPQFAKQFNWLQQWILRFFTPFSLKKASKIITGSFNVFNELPIKYTFTQQRLQYIPGAAYTLDKPMQWEQKEQCKEQYSQGCEYFLLYVHQTTYNDIIQVLKAFSQFKKWHKSNMKLIISGTLPGSESVFIQKLQSYKYRNDIVVLKNTSIYNSCLIASAYAVIVLKDHDGLALNSIESMQVGTPVIIADDADNSGAENAVIYADINNPTTIAEYLQLLYKDEKYRQTYVIRGIEKAATFSWNKSAKAFWEEITKTVNLSY